MKGDKTMFENQLGLQEQLDVMKQYGIVFDTGAPIRGILANDSIDQLANDAAMVTAANSGVPVEFTSYIDPMVIPILTATRGAREIFGEAKKVIGQPLTHASKLPKSQARLKLIQIMVKAVLLM